MECERIEKDGTHNAFPAFQRFEKYLLCHTTANWMEAGRAVQQPFSFSEFRFSASERSLFETFEPFAKFGQIEISVAKEIDRALPAVNYSRRMSQ